MSEKPKEQIQCGPELSDGRRIAFRRVDGEERVGILGPIKDGQPLSDGAEFLKIDGECQDGWHDVDVLYHHSAESHDEEYSEVPAEQARSGPAQVATPAYREGYDRIFGKQKIGLA